MEEGDEMEEDDMDDNDEMEEDDSGIDEDDSGIDEDEVAAGDSMQRNEYAPEPGSAQEDGADEADEDDVDELRHNPKTIPQGKMKKRNILNILSCFSRHHDNVAIQQLRTAFGTYPNFLTKNTPEVKRAELFELLQHNKTLKPHFDFIMELNLLLVHALQPCDRGMMAYAHVGPRYKPRQAPDTRAKIWFLLLTASVHGCISNTLQDGWVHILWDVTEVDLFFKNCMCPEEYARNNRITTLPFCRSILTNFLSDRTSVVKRKPDSVRETALKPKWWNCRESDRCYVLWELRLAKK